jgi:hypothetical protein
MSSYSTIPRARGYPPGLGRVRRHGRRGIHLLRERCAPVPGLRVGASPIRGLPRRGRPDQRQHQVGKGSVPRRLWVPEIRHTSRCRDDASANDYGRWSVDQTVVRTVTAAKADSTWAPSPRRTRARVPAETAPSPADSLFLANDLPRHHRVTYLLSR